MKKLICARDIEELSRQGGKALFIDENTIITLQARDTAREKGIELSPGRPQCAGNEEKCNESGKTGTDGIDREMIYKVLKHMMDKGHLQGILPSFDSR